MEKILYTKIDPSIITDPTIEVGAKALYVCLCTYADHKTRRCYPSVKKLAADLNISERTIKRYLSKLVLKKIITRIPTKETFSTITQINHLLSEIL